MSANSGLLPFPITSTPRLAVAVHHCLLKTVHTTLGKTGLLSNLSHALLRLITKIVENQQTFGPKSHIGLFSERWLNSWWNLPPQMPWRRPNCHALNLCSFLATLPLWIRTWCENAALSPWDGLRQLHLEQVCSGDSDSVKAHTLRRRSDTR